jgi:hypothetical protein
MICCCEDGSKFSMFQKRSKFLEYLRYYLPDKRGFVLRS